MEAKEIRDFLDNHRNLQLSAAKIEYNRLSLDSEGDRIFDVINSVAEPKRNEKDAEIFRRIEEAKDADEFVKLMRTPIIVADADKLKKKLVENEAVIMEAVKERCISTRNEHFVENALYFFTKCKENCSGWIMDNYKDFHNEYMKSMMCLVLGFRGDESMIPFLMQEAERMKSEYPGDLFDQGPYLAVSKLAENMNI